MGGLFTSGISIDYLIAASYPLNVFLYLLIIFNSIYRTDAVLTFVSIYGFVAGFERVIQWFPTAIILRPYFESNYN